VHYEDNGVTGQFYLRPFAQEFLDEMSKFYEIVIFTAALQDYADWILNRLDSKGSITHRLYRQHTFKSGSTNIKDLSKIGRQLEKTIIVDNIPENFLR
jgi:CTD small phosphatase-like protein 2